jgi:hypothetical protein
MKLMELQEAAKVKRTIDVAYEIVTPESAEYGDAEDRGWEEQNISMEPDRYDKEDGISAVDKAADFIIPHGPVEPSSSEFHQGIWYTTIDPEQDRAYFEQGESKTYSFHLNNFSVDEEKGIYKKVTK